MLRCPSPCRLRSKCNRVNPPNPSLHLDARAETVNDRHETIHREPAKIRVANTREVGSRDARAAVRGADRQVFPIKRLDDFGGQDGLELFTISVLMPLDRGTRCRFLAPDPAFTFHRNLSFRFCKRLRLRKNSGFLKGTGFSPYVSC
jgi:hypothetical protein